MNILKVPLRPAKRILSRKFGTSRKLNFEAKNFLNKLSSRRDPSGSVLGMLFEPKFTDPPDVIYLAGGLPNSVVFPFAKATFNLKNGKTLKLDEELMSKALQYGSVQGYDPLIEQMKSIVEKFHGVTDWKEKDVVITMGGTDASYQSLEMLLDEKTIILAEQPLFGSITQCIEAFGCKYIGIKRDEFGVVPSSLKEEVLKILNDEKKDIKMVFYCNFMSIKRDNIDKLHRRLESIYNIAQEFNIFILEMDPNFFLHIQKDEKRIASLLGIDTEGRVLRCDTISPLLGPGWRIGFVTGPKLLIQLISSHIDASMLSASMFSQVLISEALRSMTEKELGEYSRLIFENLQVEQKDLKSAAQLYLDSFEWEIYPEYPFLSFKTENPEIFLSKMRNSLGYFPLTVSLPTSEKKTESHLGISFLGTTAEEKQKLCSKISKMKQ